MTRLLLLVASLAAAGEARRIQINEEVENLMGREVERGVENLVESLMENLVEREVEDLVEREGRGLAEWFGWGTSQAATEAPPVRRIQGLQRRTSQVEVSSNITVSDIYLRGIQVYSNKPGISHFQFVILLINKERLNFGPLANLTGPHRIHQSAHRRGT